MKRQALIYLKANENIQETEMISEIKAYLIEEIKTEENWCGSHTEFLNIRQSKEDEK